MCSTAKCFLTSEPRFSVWWFHLPVIKWRENNLTWVFLVVLGCSLRGCVPVSCRVSREGGVDLLTWLFLRLTRRSKHSVLTIITRLHPTKNVPLGCTLFMANSQRQETIFIHNYWVLGRCPSSGILKTRKHNVSEIGSVSVLRSEGRHLLFLRDTAE
jgi:hypothetical protein